VKSIDQSARRRGIGTIYETIQLLPFIPFVQTRVLLRRANGPIMLYMCRPCRKLHPSIPAIREETCCSPRRCGPPGTGALLMMCRLWSPGHGERRLRVCVCVCVIMTSLGEPALKIVASTCKGTITVSGTVVTLNVLQLKTLVETAFEGTMTKQPSNTITDTDLILEP